MSEPREDFAVMEIAEAFRARKDKQRKPPWPFENIGDELTQLRVVAEKYLSLPHPLAAWIDKPTCAGMWVVHHVSGVVNVVMFDEGDIHKALFWVRRCYGPIPSDEAGGGK